MRLTERGLRFGVGMMPHWAYEIVAACAECGGDIKRKDYGHSLSRRGNKRRMLCPQCVSGKRKGWFARLRGRP